MGIKSTIFGKKPKAEKSESGNHAWDEIKGAFEPALGYVTQSGNMAGNLLGLSGGPAQTAALENYANSGGMKFLMDQGNKMINSNQAAKGLLQSGSTLQGIQKYGQGLGSTYLNQYMDSLFKLGNLGLGAGGVMSDAGRWSKGTGGQPGKQGLLPMALQAGAAFAGCDPRLKLDVVYVGERPDGLSEFEWTYDPNAAVKMPVGRFRGVMADEVAEKYPELLGEPVMGFMTVKEELRPERIA